MGYFSDIPIRANGQKFLFSWFNALRTAGMAIESFIGGGFIGETSFTVANNQVAAANVTGLVLNSANYKSAHIYATVRRKTASTEVVSNGRIMIQYRDLTSTWELLDEMSGDDDGVTFTVNSSGQVQYTSDNMSGGSYVGVMKFRALSFAA